MKLLLSLIILTASINSFAFTKCSHGEKKIVKVANATVLEHGQAQIEQEKVALSNSAEGLTPGEKFSGLVIKVCYDIGHIPGLKSYWKTFIVPEENVLDQF